MFLFIVHTLEFFVLISKRLKKTTQVLRNKWENNNKRKNDLKIEITCNNGENWNEKKKLWEIKREFHDNDGTKNRKFCLWTKLPLISLFVFRVDSFTISCALPFLFYSVPRLRFSRLFDSLNPFYLPLFLFHSICRFFIVSILYILFPFVFDNK